MTILSNYRYVISKLHVILGPIILFIYKKISTDSEIGSLATVNYRVSA